MSRYRRKCNKCGEIKNRDGFSEAKSTRKDGMSSHCKECIKRSVATWKAKNRNRLNKYQRDWMRRRAVTDPYKLYRRQWTDGTAYIGCTGLPMWSRDNTCRTCKADACYETFKNKGEPITEILAEFSKEDKKEAFETEKLFILNEARWNDKLLNQRLATPVVYQY